MKGVLKEHFELRGRGSRVVQAGYWPWDSDAFLDLWSFIGSL
jgi:hypothetical protein